jgi:hypothetical protein
MPGAKSNVIFALEKNIRLEGDHVMVVFSGV